MLSGGHLLLVLEKRWFLLRLGVGLGAVLELGPLVNNRTESFLSTRADLRTLYVALVVVGAQFCVIDKRLRAELHSLVSLGHPLCRSTFRYLVSTSHLP